MKKLKFNLISYKIRIFISFLILCNFYNCLFAGAPALNKDPIPTAPYSLKETNHLIVGVEWDKNKMLKFLPDELLKNNIITGGIEIFNSKKKQLLSPVSGAYIWIDVPLTNNNDMKKHIIFSIYGPNKTINTIMKSVYNLDSKLGSNKVTLINNKAIGTTSIKKKNVIILSANNPKGCKNVSGSEVIITKDIKQSKTYKPVSWKSEKECFSKPLNVEFKGSLENYKIKKLLWAKTREKSSLTFGKPSTKNKD